MGVVDKGFYIVPSGIVASNFDELATGPSCPSATIGEARVRLLGICKGSLQKLAEYVGVCHPSRQHPGSLYMMPRWFDQQHRPG